MNHDLLKRIIFDQHEVIRRAAIIPRRYEFDPHANYVLTGLRRAGKSTMLYDRARKLVQTGVSWEQIIYIQFEDERLAGFSAIDFDDILQVQAELSNETGYFFFDEIQNIEGWEKFARRMADSGEHVDITGSNARMLSSEVESTLGGRYLSKHIAPFRFDEYLDAHGVDRSAAAFYTSKGSARLAQLFDAYLVEGGLPEVERYQVPREYIESVYQKVLLGDVAARNNVRNSQALRVMMKKLTETVGRELTVNSLAKTLKAIGYSLSSDTVQTYLSQVVDAYLLFKVYNTHAKFIEREGSPKYFFGDTGLLSLFLRSDDSALLENAVAVALRDAFDDGLTYISSRRSGIDIDFYVEEKKLAIQVATTVEGPAQEREIGNLVKLACMQEGTRLVVLTKRDEKTIERDGVSIEVIPAWKFVLQELCDRH